MNIDTLKAGSELDALVGMRVMGFLRDGYMFRRQDGYGPFEFKPSSNKLDAWDVLDQLRTLPGFVSYEIMRYSHTELVKVLIVRNNLGDDQHFFGSSTSMPIAACLAALKALGVE